MLLIDDFLTEDISDSQASLLLLLDDIIRDTCEGIVLKKKYGIPFYYGKSWVCYLNPLKKEGLELCFTRGNELTDEAGLLSAKGRQLISGVVLKSIEELPAEELINVLQEAWQLDAEVSYHPIKHRRK